MLVPQPINCSNNIRKIKLFRSKLEEVLSDDISGDHESAQEHSISSFITFKDIGSSVALFNQTPNLEAADTERATWFNAGPDSTGNMNDGPSN